MDSASSMDSMIRLMKELCSNVEALHKAVVQDAEAELIDQIVSRCGDSFALLKEQGLFLASARSDHDGGHTARLQKHFNKLLESYQACLKSLSAASAHTAQKLAHLQKTRSASQEYQKIAYLG